jgi:SAM-dependent methyltransferase
LTLHQATLSLNLTRQIRWLLGLGYGREHFDRVYAATGRDAWGYERDEFATRRFQFLLKMLPVTPVSTALEVGCAEGQFTALLAQHVEHVLACDISESAIQRARQTCLGLQNVRFRCMDVRKGLPDEPVDLILFSDVLYYLSRREAIRVLEDSAKNLRPGSFLGFSNEWQSQYRLLLEPGEVLKIISDSGRWEKLKSEELKDSPTRTVTAALFRRI